MELLNILCFAKLFTLSVGKFMHSYYNKLPPNHFGDYFIYSFLLRKTIDF